MALVVSKFQPLVSRRSSLVLGLVVIASLVFVACGGGGNGGGNGEPSAAEKKKAVTSAKTLYKIGRAYADLDLAKGPCIGNPIPGLGGDWVADIAHDPRRPIDDKPQNQCSEYRSGRAHHFVELDPAGNLIRTQ